jgi:transcriptional regulator with XRE-family HTH domain
MNTAINERINPKSLKYYRKRCGFETQQALADKLSCTKDQVSRWETGSTAWPKPHLLNKICKALNITAAQLQNPPPEDTSATNIDDIGTVQLNARVTAGTRTSIQVVSRMFGIRPADLVEMAPLLFLLSAHDSLAERRAAISHFEQKLEEAQDEGAHQMPHLLPRLGEIESIREAIASEKQWIAEEDLFTFNDTVDEFSPDLRDREDRNPYANHIKRRLQELPDAWFDKESVAYRSNGMPWYWMPTARLAEIIGINDLDLTDEEQHKILQAVSLESISLAEVLRAKSSHHDFRGWLVQASADSQEHDLSDLDWITEERQREED